MCFWLINFIFAWILAKIVTAISLFKLYEIESFVSPLGKIVCNIIIFLYFLEKHIHAFYFFSIFLFDRTGYWLWNLRYFDEVIWKVKSCCWISRKNLHGNNIYCKRNYTQEAGRRTVGAFNSYHQGYIILVAQQEDNDSHGWRKALVRYYIHMKLWTTTFIPLCKYKPIIKTVIGRSISLLLNIFISFLFD